MCQRSHFIVFHYVLCALLPFRSHFCRGRSCSVKLLFWEEHFPARVFVFNAPESVQMIGIPLLQCGALVAINKDLDFWDTTRKTVHTHCTLSTNYTTVTNRKRKSKRKKSRRPKSIQQNLKTSPLLSVPHGSSILQWSIVDVGFTHFDTYLYPERNKKDTHIHLSSITKFSLISFILPYKVNISRKYVVGHTSSVFYKQEGREQVYTLPLVTESVASPQSAPFTGSYCAEVHLPLSLHDDPVRRFFVFSLHIWEN